MIQRRARRLAVALAILATVGCDQATKRAATELLEGSPGHSYFDGTVRLVYAENMGGMLGLGSRMPPRVRSIVFSVAVGLVLGGMVVFTVRRRWDAMPLLGLTFFIAGGASNWIDRVSGGPVVDFLVLDLGPVHTGIFNVADIAIFLGAALFLAGEIRSGRANREPPSPQPAG